VLTFELLAWLVVLTAAPLPLEPLDEELLAEALFEEVLFAGTTFDCVKRVDAAEVCCCNASAAEVDLAPTAELIFGT
jgi:hypothetical protein